MKNLDQLHAQNARLEAAKTKRVTDDELRALGLIGPQGGRRHAPTPGTDLNIAFKRLLDREWAYIAPGVVFARGAPTYKPTPLGLRECEKLLPRIKALEVERMTAEAKRVKDAHDADPIKDGYGYHRQTYSVDVRVGARILLTGRQLPGHKATIVPPERCAYHLESIHAQLDCNGFLLSVHPTDFEILPDTDIAEPSIEREPSRPMRAEFARLFAEAPV